MKHLIIFVLIVLGLPFKTLGQLPEDFSDQTISENWTMPMGLTFDETGRMFVWEKAGKVFIVDTSGNKIPEPLLDIHEEVGNWRDHGLLGFALDPEFLNNGNYYLLYAVDRHYLLHYGTSEYHPDSTTTHQASIGRVTRYTADASTNFQTTIPGSRKVLIGEDITTGIPLYHESHGIGTLLFGEDGTLMVSCGDGNSNSGVDIGGDTFSSYASQALADGIITEDQDIGSFKAQYLGSLNGKVLRISPETGAGIASNPFYDPADPESAKSRTWAYGFRNPFRMVLIENTGSHNPNDANPGTLLVGDVGASQWEELNKVDRGGLNFGWPLKEGLIPFWGFWNADHPENKLAPNPLFDGNDCNQEFFDFKDLYAEEQAGGQAYFPNPCDPNQPIPESANPKMETNPILTWGHNEYNLPTKTYIGVFNNDGKIQAIDITSPESPVESDRFDGNSSITGTFYHGDNFPEYYKGLYFHADYSGWIKVLHFDENYILQKIEPFHDASKQIIHLVEHPLDGCLYYLSFKNGGSIHKICYGGNPPPIAIATTDTIYGPTPLPVAFDASESYDPFGLPITYHWDFGDGNESEEINPTHVYTTLSNTPAFFTVRLTVTDSLGATGIDELLISINNTPPQVEILTPKDSSFYSMKGNTIYHLNANVVDAEHSEEELTYEWQTFLHHNSHAHPEASSFETNPITFISPVGCEDDANYWFRVRLTVTDAAGLMTIKESNIFPYCGPDFFELIDLKATATEQAVELTWNILSEDGVVQYEVQRSPYFETIGTLPSTGLGNYSFLDSSPILGENFYRIKAIRADEIFDYSNSVKIFYPPKADFVIYPNPASDLINIELKKATSDQINLEIFDASGKRAIKTSWPTQPGETFKGSILTWQLANGVYFFRFIDGEKIEEGKILIMK
jgi:glucose/arabinose dehydrogenase